MSMAPLNALVDGSTGRGLTSALWQKSLHAWAANDPLFGESFFEDFPRDFTDAITGTTSATDSDGWTGQDASSGSGTYTVAVQDRPGGWVKMSNDGTSNDDGVEFGLTKETIALPSHSSDSRGRAVFECRVDNDDADCYGFFLTDAGATTPLTAGSDALADVGYIGIQVKEGGDVVVMTSSANGGTTDSVTIIEAADFTKTGEHRLGFAVNPDSSIEVAVDGQWYPLATSSIDPDSLPTGDLAPRWFATAGDGTTAPDMEVDYLAYHVGRGA